MNKYEQRVYVKMKSLRWKGNDDVSGNLESLEGLGHRIWVRQDSVVEETTLKYEAMCFLQKNGKMWGLVAGIGDTRR